MALGLDGLGSSACADLMKNGFYHIDTIIEKAAAGRVEDFSQIEGFGEITAKLMIQHFTDPQNLTLISQLREIGLNFSEEPPTMLPATTTLPFKNQVWVITGSFEFFNPRSKAAEEIEKRGGKTTGAVSSKTTHLLCGEASGSKLDKARELNIPVILEAEFLKMLEENKV